jgi:hypothetical protein
MTSTRCVDTVVASHPTTIVSRQFADAIHVVVTQRRRPGCLVTPTRALLRSRDAPVAQIVARRLAAVLDDRQDPRRVLLSLALLDATAAADDADDALLNAVVAPIVAAIVQTLFSPDTNKEQ